MGKFDDEPKNFSYLRKRVCIFETVTRREDGLVRGVLFHKDGEKKKAFEIVSDESTVVAALQNAIEDVSKAHEGELLRTTPARFAALPGNESKKVLLGIFNGSRTPKCAGCQGQLSYFYYQCGTCGGIICPQCLTCGCKIIKWNMPQRSIY